MSRPPVDPDKVTLRRVDTNRGYRWMVYSPRRIPGLAGAQLKSGKNTGMYRYPFALHRIALQVVINATKDRTR